MKMNIKKLSMKKAKKLDILSVQSNYPILKLIFPEKIKKKKMKKFYQKIPQKIKT